MSFAGIDIGQSGCKGKVYSREGRPICEARVSYGYRISEGCVSLCPTVLWRSLKSLIRCLVRDSRKDPIESIGFSFLGCSVVALSRAGQPVTDLLIAGNKTMSAYFGTKIKSMDRLEAYRVSGLPLREGYPLSKILWLMRSGNRRTLDISRFMLLEDYVYYKLGLTPTLDYSLAALTGLLDVRRRRWSERLLESFGLDSSFLSELGETGVSLGTIPRKVMSEIGVNGKIEVLSGGFDQYMGAIGTGSVHRGACSNSCGTTDCLTFMIDYPEDIDPFYSHNYQIGCFQVKNKYAVLNFVNSAGSIIEWYSRNIGNARESRCRNRKRPQESGPSRNSLIVLPHFLGSGTPWLDEYSRGIILGLDLRTRREDIYLAILEGIVFELRTNLELFESISNRRYKIRAAGGGSASRAWMQIRSNILGRAITEIEDKEAGCLAGAMFSLVHRGVFRDIESAAKELVRVKRTYYPDSRSRQYYREKYGIFAEVYGNNRRSLRSISQLRWG